MFLRKIVLALMAFIVFSLPWATGAFGLTGLGGFGLLSMVGILAFLAAVAFLLFGQQGLGKAPVPWDPSLTFFGAFVAFNFASVGWAVQTNTAISSSIAYAQLLVFIWLLAFLRAEKGALSILLHAYLFGAFLAIVQIVSALGFSQLFELHDRLEGAGRTANGFAYMLVLAIPIALYLFQRGRTVLSWFYLSYIPVAAFLVFLSASRTGFVILATTLVVGLWSILKVERRGQMRFSPKVAVLSGIVAVTFAMVAAPYLSGQFQRQSERIATLTQDETAGGRTVKWAAAIAAYRDHPVLGVGSGGIRAVLPDYIGHDGLIVSLAVKSNAVHNTYLEIAADTGALGFLLYLAALGFVALRLPYLPRPDRLLFVSMMSISLLAATTLSLETRREFYFALFLPLALGVWRRHVARLVDLESTVKPSGVGGGG